MIPQYTSQGRKKNLRSCVSYITHFVSVSGLQCNIDKTVVVPIGANFDTNDILCPDLKLEWDNKFTILGFEIDSKLEKLEDNYNRIHKNVDNLISKWQCYRLTIMGRVTITKSLLLSQYTYIGSVLDMRKPLTDLIQKKLNTFVLHNQKYVENESKGPWLTPEVLYGPTSQGGLNMVKVDEFFHSLKCSWIRRYAIGLINDHWADLLDQIFGLNPANREQVLLWGSERFKIFEVQPKPCLTGFISSYRLLKANFPTDLSTGDNSWFTQPVFYNKSIKMKRLAGRDPVHATPGDFGLSPGMIRVRLCDLYSNLTFISKEELDVINGRQSPNNGEN